MKELRVFLDLPALFLPSTQRGQEVQSIPKVVTAPAITPTAHATKPASAVQVGRAESYCVPKQAVGASGAKQREGSPG